MRVRGKLLIVLDEVDMVGIYNQINMWVAH